MLTSVKLLDRYRSTDLNVLRILATISIRKRSSLLSNAFTFPSFQVARKAWRKDCYFVRGPLAFN